MSFWVSHVQRSAGTGTIVKGRNGMGTRHRQRGRKGELEKGTTHCMSLAVKGELGRVQVKGVEVHLG